MKGQRGKSQLIIVLKLANMKSLLMTGIIVSLAGDVAAIFRKTAIGAKGVALLSTSVGMMRARGGTKAPFSTGPRISSSQANFNGEHPYGEGAKKGPYRRKTLPVGSFKPNAYGVYDIHGNVYEWVEDCWSPNHTGAPSDGRVRKDGDCKFRIMRGGSWVTHAYQMRASKRLRYTTDYRYDDYGFRIARTLE